MRASVVPSLLIASALSLAPPPLGAGELTVTDAARRPVELYLQAHATGDGELIRQAFHPDARIVSQRDGAVASLSRDEFAARFTGRPAADEAQRRRRIVTLDVHGTAGMARVALDYPEVRFVDYLSLLEVAPGDWRIVHKTFHREAPAPAAPAVPASPGVGRP